MKKQTVQSLPSLKTLEDVDKALLRIGRIDIEIEEINNAVVEAVRREKEIAQSKVGDLPDEKKALEEQVANFCHFHKSQFRKKKSIELPFGIVGFEWTKGKVKTLKGWTEAKVVEKLRSLRKRNFLRYRDPLLDKEAIHDSNLSDEELAGFGLTIDKKEEFYYKIKRESILTPALENAGKEDGDGHVL